MKNPEPPSTSWDIVFRRYSAYLAQAGIYYPLTGVLSNDSVEVAEVKGEHVDSVDIESTMGLEYSNNISTIGYDWYTQSLQTIDSLVYFVKSRDGNIYKLVFTGYGGMSTGNIYFNITEQAATAIDERSNIQNWTTYPNPAENVINTIFTLKEDSDVEINIHDQAGRVVKKSNYFASQGINNVRLNTDDLAPGYYLLSVTENGRSLTTKFVKTR